MDSSRAIENLLYTYAERIDLGDLEGVAELFRRGCIRAPANDSEVAGYDAILNMYRNATRLYPCGTPRTRHITTNTIIEVDEAAGTATARSYFSVLQATPELPLQMIIAGRYHDRFARTDGQWHFVERIMLPEQIGDLSQHLLYDASRLGQ